MEKPKGSPIEPKGSPIRKFRSSRQLCFLDLFIQKTSVLII